jgi:hypothetical protein
VNAPVPEADLADARRTVAEGEGRFFRLTSVWVFEAQLSEIAEILVEPESITCWWASSFLRAEVLHPGTAGHLGKVVRLHSKGLLPHTFQFVLRVTGIRYPEFVCFAVKGDFEGEAAVSTRPLGEGRIALVFDWRVTICHPLIQHFVPLARWLFIMNHRWSMRSGERALRREILRRRGASSDAFAPTFESSPSFPHNMAFIRRLYRWRPAASEWCE